VKPALAAVAVVALFVGIEAQQLDRNASAILADMRRALGGDTVLEGIKTFTVRGDVSRTRGPAAHSMSYELLALLPDHYMTIEHDVTSAGPADIDITYFNGFAGNTLIQRIDSNIALPVASEPQAPDSSAQEEGRRLQRRQFGLLTLALLGRSLDSYPWTLVTNGTNNLNGRPVEYVEARGPDRFTARLHVEASTHLPIMIAWDGDAPGSGRPNVAGRLEFSDFKREDGVNWPHRMKRVTQTQTLEDIRLGRFKINPRLDAARFSVK
jgi:hypothetical protein